MSRFHDNAKHDGHKRPWYILAYQVLSMLKKKFIKKFDAFLIFFFSKSAPKIFFKVTPNSKFLLSKLQNLRNYKVLGSSDHVGRAVFHAASEKDWPNGLTKLIPMKIVTQITFSGTNFLFKA